MVKITKGEEEEEEEENQKGRKRRRRSIVSRTLTDNC